MRPSVVSTGTAVLLILLPLTAIDISDTTATIIDMKVDSSGGCLGIGNLTCGGRVFYITPVHHVSSYQNPNVAQLLRNAVRHVSPHTANPIQVLVYANVNNRAQAIFDSISGQPDIFPTKTTVQNDLLSISSYDVVIVQSNGLDFSNSVEESIAEFAANGGGVIGGHDVIWAGFNNPTLYELFGAVAFGDASNPGIGWYKGTVTLSKAIDHPITTGIADSWDLLDEEYFFDVQFKQPMTVVPETNHSGDMIPVAWTLTLPQIQEPNNLTAEVIGDDVRLEWDNPNASQVAHHLIYRAESPTSFDFSSPYHDTSGDPYPKIEEWTDHGAALPTSPTEYYYIVRAVTAPGFKSPTSKTVGKWTRQFDQGLNSMSMPLKTFTQSNLSWLASDMSGVGSMDWLNNQGDWVRYDLSKPNPDNDTVLELGTTYQLDLIGPTHYTFVGYPGSMIRFMDRLGDSSDYIGGLTLSVQGYNVALDWNGTPGALRFHIFRSIVREDVLNMSQNPLLTTKLTSFIDFGILNGFSGEIFYVVVAEDDVCGVGGSTYSRGLVKRTFNKGIDSLALEIKPTQPHSIDWFVDQTGGVEGIAYVVSSAWKFHTDAMPSGVYDGPVEMCEGYQISIMTDPTTIVYLGQ